MKKVLFSLFACLSFLFSYSQEDTDTTDLVQHKLFRKNFIKIAPALGGKEVFKGGILSYETGISIRKMSVNLAFRYFSGYGADEILRPIPEHLTFEIHPRYWPMAYFRGPFFCPLLVVYSTGDFAGGIASGFQFPFGKMFVAETFAGLQSTTSVEGYDDPVFFRINLNVGIRFPVKK